jgi:hypothetical protein
VRRSARRRGSIDEVRECAGVRRHGVEPVSRVSAPVRQRFYRSAHGAHARQGEKAKAEPGVRDIYKAAGMP